jgi:radical SAM superfamily enzyme YgiQ (UPF0313 family)
MYKRSRFEKKSVEELEEEIKTVAGIYGKDSKELFIGDSNSLTVKELPDILRIVHRELPNFFLMIRRPPRSTLKRLGVERLKDIRKAGLTRVHIGLESGDGETLKLMDKGTTPEVMIEGARMAKQADLEVSEYVLLGAGGMARWKEHAHETAKVLSAIDPDFIRMRTLTIQEGTPLDKMVKDGKFEPVKPLERLEETLIIVSELELTDTVLASDHVTNYLYIDGRMVYHGVYGHMPDEKDEMVALIKNTLEFLRDYDGEIWDSNYMLQKGYLMGL